MVVGVKFQADACYCIYEADPIFVEIEKKFAHFVNVHLKIILSQGHKCDYQRILHLGLVEQLQFSARISEFLEDKRPRNRREDEHVEKDEEDEDSVVGSLSPNRRQLVVRVGVIGACNVHNEYHLAQVFVIVFIFVNLNSVRQTDQL